MATTIIRISCLAESFSDGISFRGDLFSMATTEHRRTFPFTRLVVEFADESPFDRMFLTMKDYPRQCET